MSRPRRPGIGSPAPGFAATQTPTRDGLKLVQARRFVVQVRCPGAFHLMRTHATGRTELRESLPASVGRPRSVRVPRRRAISDARFPFLNLRTNVFSNGGATS